MYEYDMHFFFVVKFAGFFFIFKILLYSPAQKQLLQDIEEKAEDSGGAGGKRNLTVNFDLGGEVERDQDGTVGDADAAGPDSLQFSSLQDQCCSVVWPPPMWQRRRRSRIEVRYV